MSAFVDTSVLVRYLTADPPAMLDAARRIVDEVDVLVLTDVVLAETAFVLLSVYRVPRRAVVDSLVDVVRKRNISVHAVDKDVAIQALLLCRGSTRVSFVDAMLWAAARSVAGTMAEPMIVYSFDERFPAAGIALRADK